jgi:hypothetical protein
MRERRMEDGTLGVRVDAVRMAASMPELDRVLEELHRAREAEGVKDARIRELEAALTEAESAMSATPSLNMWDLGPSDAVVTVRKALGLPTGEEP